MKYKITWEVYDGYVGSRPQHMTFDTHDYCNDDEEWNEFSQEEKDEHLEQAVRDDFNNKISFYITSKEEIN